MKTNYHNYFVTFVPNLTPFNTNFLKKNRNKLLAMETKSEQEMHMDKIRQNSMKIHGLSSDEGSQSQISLAGNGIV